MGIQFYLDMQRRSGHVHVLGGCLEPVGQYFINHIITLNSRKQTVQQCVTWNSQLPEFTKACPFQFSNNFEQYYWSPQLVGRICMFICNYTHIPFPQKLQLNLSTTMKQCHLTVRCEKWMNVARWWTDRCFMMIHDDLEIQKMLINMMITMTG